MTWTVETHIRRSTPAGAPIALRVPLLPGEAPTRANLVVEHGEAAVSLGDELPHDGEGVVEEGKGAQVGAALEGLDLPVLQEDAVAGEADVHGDAPKLHLVHRLAAVRAVAVVEVPEPSRLVGRHVPADPLRELALVLRVLPGEVVVLGVGGLHALGHVRHSFSWPMSRLAAAASSPVGRTSRNLP